MVGAQVNEQPAQEPIYPQRERGPPEERLGVTAYNEDHPLRGEEETVDPWWPGWKQGEYGQTAMGRGMVYTDV